jgi:hypothetical protein
MNQWPHRFPRYGTWGLTVLVLMETAIFCSHAETLQFFPWWRITVWATPVNWWAYIFVVDAWIYRRKGTSLLTARRELLALQCILSVAFWCVFEAYNRILPGWRYENLLGDLALRFVGYAASFATIMPGMFLTAELIQSYRAFAGAQSKPWHWSETALNFSQWLGLAFCVVPAFLPEEMRGHLWCFVWLGWLLMLEPINYRRTMPSLYRDWESGDWSRTLQLLAAGAIGGLLWEFWNMWAYTKWVYIFPPGLAAKYFEMPVLGFLGFLPFALDYFVMFHFVASFYTREDKLGL